MEYFAIVGGEDAVDLSQSRKVPRGVDSSVSGFRYDSRDGYVNLEEWETGAAMKGREIPSYTSHRDT
jgi:hypothetical protein